MTKWFVIAVLVLGIWFSLTADNLFMGNTFPKIRGF